MLYDNSLLYFNFYFDFFKNTILLNLTFKRMKKFILLFINLFIAGLLLSQNIVQKQASDDRTKNFPKQNVFISKTPASHNLWVFILAGQSNMAGRGLVEPSDTLPDSRILIITKDKQWILAKEPLHFYEPAMRGLDCGLSFGREILKHIPDSVSIALIPCAVGGSSIGQWLGDSLFRDVQLLSNFKDKVNFAKQYGTVKGILWHQGENDATQELTPKYKENLKKLISEFRNSAGNDELPFLIGELGAFAIPERQCYWDSINHIIHAVAEKDKNTFVIGTEDLETKGDNVHFNSAGQRSMGWRFARIYAGYYVNGRYTYKDKTIGKICTIEKQLYIPSPDSTTATDVNIQYIGAGLKRREIRANISSSDWTDMHRMRGSNVGLDSLKCPGRKWYSISDNGGLTWSEIKDLRYDTGEQFYSPATFAKTIRSTVTGKLYCFLNISTSPPVGNGPRYPLQVVEIDEDKVCLKKETVTIIDELNPGLDSKHLQLSNFGLLEDREYQTIELYLTRLGGRGGGAGIWDSDTYRYVIRFLE